MSEVEPPSVHRTTVVSKSVVAPMLNRRRASERRYNAFEKVNHFRRFCPSDRRASAATGATSRAAANGTGGTAAISNTNLHSNRLNGHRLPYCCSASKPRQSRPLFNFTIKIGRAYASPIDRPTARQPGGKSSQPSPFERTKKFAKNRKLPVSGSVCCDRTAAAALSHVEPVSASIFPYPFAMVATRPPPAVYTTISPSFPDRSPPRRTRGGPAAARTPPADA